MVDKTLEGICDLKGKYSGNCQNISNPDREITTGIKYRRRIYILPLKSNSQEQCDRALALRDSSLAQQQQLELQYNQWKKEERERHEVHVLEFLSCSLF